MPATTGWVEYASAGETVPAYFARPPGIRTPLPGVLLIHEVWGVDDHIEDLARRFALAGYEVLAPDLWSSFGGVGGRRPEILTRERVAALRAFLVANPAAWASGPGREAALAQVAPDERTRLQATADRLLGSDEGRAQRFVRYTEIMADGVRHLRAQPDAATRKVAAVGFCMGGGIAGQLTCAEVGLDAAVAFYGTVPPVEHVPRIRCPMLGNYADPDPRITPFVPAFAEAMRAAGKSFEFDVAAAPHAYFNDTSGAYRPHAARAAWARTLAFLNAQVGD